MAKTNNQFDKAIKQLDQLEKNAQKMCSSIGDLANYAALYAQSLYGSGEKITCYAKQIKGGYEVVAKGEPVFFAEFGTGVNTDESKGNGMREPYEAVGMKIEPGSWSMSEFGKGTWLKWWESHDGDMTDYPYNRVPKNAMWKSFQMVEESLNKMAREGLE